MKKYRTRPGIVLSEICGEYLLVSAREAREHCPYILQINETSAFLWKQMKDGADISKLIEAVSEEYEVERPDEAKAAIEAFLKQMVEMEYLLAEDE